MQGFVFGDVVSSIYDLKLGQAEDRDEADIPSKIIIFIDRAEQICFQRRAEKFADSAPLARSYRARAFFRNYSFLRRAIQKRDSRPRERQLRDARFRQNKRD